MDLGFPFWRVYTALKGILKELEQGAHQVYDDKKMQKRREHVSRNLIYFWYMFIVSKQDL